MTCLYFVVDEQNLCLILGTGSSDMNQKRLRTTGIPNRRLAARRNDIFEQFLNFNSTITM